MVCSSVLVSMFNSKKDMYSDSAFFFSDLSWGPVHKYGGGYDLWWKTHSMGFPYMHGGILGDFDLQWSCFGNLQLTGKSLMTCDSLGNFFSLTRGLSW